MKTSTKVVDAVEMIPDGSVLHIGGFMGVGSPRRLIDELVRQGKRDMTIVCNDTARPGHMIGKLIDAGVVSKVITSHIGTNPVTQQKMIAGEIEVVLMPQGTLAECVRAAGYGLGGVLTATGVGTIAAEGKQTIDIDGKTFIVERPIPADFALVAPAHADYNGNLNFTLTANNFNPIMCMAAKVCIAEADQIVPVGVLAPDDIEIPGMIVDYLIERAAV